MSTTLNRKLAAISRRFRIPGEFKAGEPYGAGHINDTYRVSYERCRGIRRYILQRINGRVFPYPDLIMANIRRVSDHLRSKRVLVGNGPVRPSWLMLIPAVDGKPYWIDGAGDYWRACLFIEKTYACEVARHPAQAAGAGTALGRFFRDLVDLPGPRLHATIPDFHHTPKRLAALQAAVQADPLGRAAGCQPDIEFALSRELRMGLVVQGLAAGTLPERVCHNDTKLNNVLLDKKTHAGVCVVDLDTVMPGSVLYDFGDLVRSTVNPAVEDETDFSLVQCRLEMFAALCEGYLGAAGSSLTKGEKELLTTAGPLITLELGMRFLTDYLQGDTYFKTAYSDHNLIRCRGQFRLVAEMERKADRMAEIVDRCLYV